MKFTLEQEVFEKLEDLLDRISKGKGMASINAIVDMGNAVSLKYMLPIGAHDIDTMKDNISIRYSRGGDYFIPFGSEKKESLPEGELVYAVGPSVRTRKWIWRQSEEGKTSLGSANIFFPIDGFTNTNKEAMLLAQEELANLLKDNLKCQVKLAFIDKDNRTIDLD